MLVRANAARPELSSGRLTLLAEPLTGESADRSGSQTLVDGLREMVGELGGEASRDVDKLGGVVGDEDGLASDDGHQDAVAAERLVGNLEEIILEDDQVRKLAPGQGADLVVGAQEAGRVDGDGADDLLTRQAALGTLGKGGIIRCALEGGRVGVLGVASAGDADLEGEELVEGVNLVEYLVSVKAEGT